MQHTLLVSTEWGVRHRRNTEGSGSSPRRRFESGNLKLIDRGGPGPPRNVRAGPTGSFGLFPISSRLQARKGGADGSSLSHPMFTRRDRPCPRRPFFPRSAAASTRACCLLVRPVATGPREITHYYHHAGRGGSQERRDLRIAISWDEAGRDTNKYRGIYYATLQRNHTRSCCQPPKPSTMDLSSSV
jgi:hypothetical protein